MKRGLIVGLIAAVIFLILVIIFWTDSAHWFLRYTGADAESGTWYGFWSGFGGSIPDFLILGSIITIYRHHNCHVKGCLDLGSRSKAPLISPARRTTRITRAASDRCQRM